MSRLAGVEDEDLYKLLASPGGFAQLCDSRFVLPPHLQYLNQKLVDLAAGRIRRLIVQMPPRHGKSELCSRYTPAWYLALYPHNRVILASYEHTFAESWGRKARDVFEEYAGPLFGQKLRKDMKTASAWGVDGHDGSMMCAGVGGPMTGKGANLLIIDDPVKNDTEAYSETYRQKAWDWYRSTARTRSEPGGSIMIVMTRWHHDDLAGRCLGGMEAEEEGTNADQWEVVDFPAVCEVDEDMLGRKRGDALWPARYNRESLDAIKATVGTSWWTALYQQKPVPEGGGLIRDSWFRYYDKRNKSYECGEVVIDPTDLMFFTVVDLAVSVKERSDYTVISTWAYTGKYDKLLLIDIVRKRMEAPETIAAIKAEHKKYNTSIVWVEKTAYQLAMVQFLRSEGVPVRELQADKDKVARAMSASPHLEAGRVWFPERAPWKHDYEEELLQFPAGAHDDQVDVTAYAVAYCMPRRWALEIPKIDKKVMPWPKGITLNQPT